MTAAPEGFLRQVLSLYTDLDPARIRINRGPHGKPALTAPAPPLDFNLSAGGDWQAMVVSDGAAVGIDLEYCDTERDVLRLARRFFSPDELADLQACTDQQCIDRFYEYWTLKEASIKAGGGSLVLELENTAFALRYPSAALAGGSIGTIVPRTRMPAVATWYSLMQPVAGYRLALCCRASLDFTPGLRLREMQRGGIAIERDPVLLAVSGGAG